MSFLARFKSLDIYRDIPKDLTQQTTTGALVSVICGIAIIYLFISEFSSYLTIQTESQMYVDAPRDTADSHAMIQINLNITLHQVPCAILSVDAQDIMGTHIVDVGGELRKSRLSSMGLPMVDSAGYPLPPEGGDPVQQRGEGCNVHGYLIVKKVPGNFHISCHAHPDLIEVFYAQSMMNVSHTIHHLSFGDTVRVNAAAGTNPLNGVSRIVVPNEENRQGESPVSFEYYIKVVPTTFEFIDGTIEHSYQFDANSNEVIGHYRLPALYFRYDTSPITMKFRQFRTAFSHFVVQVCAIIGGVFTVMGMINTFVHSSLEHVLKKAQINKLG